MDGKSGSSYPRKVSRLLLQALADHHLSETLRYFASRYLAVALTTGAGAEAAIAIHMPSSLVACADTGAVTVTEQAHAALDPGHRPHSQPGIAADTEWQPRPKGRPHSLATSDDVKPAMMLRATQRTERAQLQAFAGRAEPAANRGMEYKGWPWTE